MGDVIHALPTLAAVKNHWPSSKIYWVVNPEWEPLLPKPPFLESVVIFPRNQMRGLHGPGRFWSFLHGLRKLQPEATLDLQGLFRSGLMTLASGASVRVGFQKAREAAWLFYQIKVRNGAFLHAVYRNLQMLEPLGIPLPGNLSYPMAGGEPVEGLPENYVVIHPFARGDGKSLPSSVANGLVEELQPKIPVVLVGKADEHDFETPKNGLCLVNRCSLPQLISVMRGAAAVVSADSGPMHLAAAVQPKVLGLHTWSDPALVGPCRPEATVLKGGKIYAMRDILAGQVVPRSTRLVSKADLPLILNQLESYLIPATELA